MVKGPGDSSIPEENQYGGFFGRASEDPDTNAGIIIDNLMANDSGLVSVTITFFATDSLYYSQDLLMMDDAGMV